MDVQANALGAGPPAELIFGDWYPAARVDTLRKGQTSTALLLGVPLLLGRKNDNTIFAMKDLCPHRGIPLSAGWFDGDQVQCKYHGWKFEPCSGQCTEIPSLTGFDVLQPAKIYASSYPCEERDGYAWVYLPEAGSGKLKGELPPVPELPKFSASFRGAHLTADLPCNVDHGIIGLMDPAHGPFVHQAWWWRSRASIHEKTKHFEPIPGGFRMSAHAPSGNSAPYKLLGVYGEPDHDDDRLRAAESPLRDDPLRRQVVFQLDDGDAGDAFDVPNRRGRGVECVLSSAVCDVDRDVFWSEIRASGSGDNGRAGARAAISSGADADRRCGQTGEVVLRAEAGAAGKERSASAERAGRVALEILTHPPGLLFSNFLFRMNMLAKSCKLKYCKQRGYG